MTPRKSLPTRRGLVGALLSCTAITISATASHAQGIGVIDLRSVSEQITQTQTQISQLTELTNIRNLEMDQLMAIGEFGSLGGLFGGSGGGSGGGGIGSDSDFFTNMENFAFDPCAINLCQGGNDPVGTTDLEEAREWAQQNFYAADVLDYETERDLREIRRRGVIYAATNGVALATVTSNDLANAGEGAQVLEDLSAQSTDLRGDIRANSAIALAAYKVQLQQLAMLTSLLEIEAMNAIDNTSIYHETGGSSFANALNEDDFATNDPSQRIRVTIPNQGSAGGLGMGGGLIGAVGGNGGGLSGLLADLGSGSGLSNVLGNGSDPLANLVSSMESGALPSINPNDLSLSTVLADSASLAEMALPENVGTEIGNGLSLIQNGLANGGTQGNVNTLMGLSQTMAGAGGNDSLVSALNAGTLSLLNGDTDMAISFAEGVIRDIQSNGVTGATPQYLRDQIAGTENGTVDITTLVMDAAAILANSGRDANPDVAQVLALDPQQVSEQNLQDLLAEALESLAGSTGDAAMRELAGAVRSIDEASIEEIRIALAEAQQAQVDVAPAGGNSSGNGVFE